MTETQKVLAAIDKAAGGLDEDGIVEASGLGAVVVRLIVSGLNADNIIRSDRDRDNDTITYSVTRWGGEIMGTRAAVAESAE